MKLNTILKDTMLQQIKNVLQLFIHKDCFISSIDLIIKSMVSRFKLIKLSIAVLSTGAN